MTRQSGLGRPSARRQSKCAEGILHKYAQVSHAVDGVSTFQNWFPCAYAPISGVSVRFHGVLSLVENFCA
jgi:hypothetical protein